MFQRAYLLGYRRALTRMRHELNAVIREEMAIFRNKIDGIERQCEQAREVALAMAERDPKDAAALNHICSLINIHPQKEKAPVEYRGFHPLS